MTKLQERNLLTTNAHMFFRIFKNIVEKLWKYNGKIAPSPLKRDSIPLHTPHRPFHRARKL